ncbi:hypothetical protein [Pseudofrankia inefficax]|uniref:DUF2637 domain-containing protein n=1 Tax=Pseudofrankia inefficax (strain DSM 45817 / CECT 9037 / DDB 130130 / EuI1c) TaxID=298654 RepID=E3JDQ6_PSEI1|nr:hypothetical protein [Pseudofrankia inefficax]ADP84822.1 hypothetical protein FraEuI1c_6853 [Pseudofrankia inefficax]
MSWTEDRRADRNAAREQDRADRRAHDEQALALRRLAGEQALAAARQAGDLAAHKQATRAAGRQARRAEARKTRAAAAGWLAGHLAELLVYPLALVSAVLAVPAMAAYGRTLYGPTGFALSILSELGGWAFAFAVQASRHRHPDRPTGMLTAGIGVFALVGAALNFAHGSTVPGGSPVHGVVMAVVSVAGIVAHQLVVAAPPRSRAERAAARRTRREADRIERAQRLAARASVIEIDPDGTARLVYPAGAYTLRRRLTPISTPTAPADRSRRRGSRTNPPAAETVAPEPVADVAPVPAVPSARRPAGATRPGGSGATRPDRGAGRREIARLYAAVPADDTRSGRQLAADLAAQAGLSTATARRYIADLHKPTPTPAESSVPATVGGAS